MSQIHGNISNYTINRLKNDLKEIKQCHEQYINILPLDDNILEWHGNLIPQEGRYKGIILHCILLFPDDYPISPPQIKLGTVIPHTNVFSTNFICMDIIKNRRQATAPYTGWSSAYSVKSIMMQLNSFLFDDYVEQDHGGIYHSLYDKYRDSNSARIALEKAFSDAENYVCNKCGHSYQHPYPALKVAVPDKDPIVVRKNIYEDNSLIPRAVEILNEAMEPENSEILGDLVGKAKIILDEHYATFNGDEDNTMIPLDLMIGYYNGSGNGGSGNGENITDETRITYATKFKYELDTSRSVGIGWNWFSNSRTCTCDTCIHLQNTLRDSREDIDNIINDGLSASNFKMIKDLENSNNYNNRKVFWDIVQKLNYDDQLVKINSNNVSIPLLFDNIKLRNIKGTLKKRGITDQEKLEILDGLSVEERGKLASELPSLEKLLDDPYLWDRKDQTCFITKQSFEDTILGYGIEVRYYRNSYDIRELDSQLNLMSVEAYNDIKVRRSVWNRRFLFWMPIFITKSHANRARHLLERQISLIHYGMYHDLAELEQLTDVDKFVISAHRKWYNKNKFDPHHALLVLSKLMSSTVVKMMRGIKFISINALEGYCQFHRLLLQFVEWYPEIKGLAEQRIKLFINSDVMRHKKFTPSLGEFLPYLTITDKYDWIDIAGPYMEEMFDRNARWILREHHDLAFVEDELSEYNLDRIERSFSSTLVGKKTSIYAIYFCKMVSNKPFEELVKMYDYRYGKPDKKLVADLQKVMKQVDEMTTWDQFYEYIGLHRPINPVLANKLRESVQNSEDKGYHSLEELGIKLESRDEKRYGRTGWHGTKFWAKEQLKAKKDENSGWWRKAECV